MKERVLFASPVALVVVHLLCGQLAADPAAPGGGAAVQLSPGTAPIRSQNARTLPVPNYNLEEERVFRALAKPTQVEFSDLSLPDAMQFLSDFHNISIRIDADALNAAQIAADTPVTLKRQVSFQRIANLLVEPLGLDWYVAGTEIIVTTRAAAAEAVHGRLEKLLEPELQIIDYLCELTDAQRQKLQLAAQGDIRRLSAGIAERAQQLPLSRNDEQRVNDVCLEMEQLQRNIQTGPFGHDSLFRKSLETTLTAAQMVKYDPIRAVLQARGLVGTLQRGPDVILGVHLHGATFSDDDLARLKGFTVLGYLWVQGTEISDTGLASLKDLANLRELNLGGTRVADAGLAHLNELKNLRELSLRGATAVTDAGLVHLKGLTGLQSLDLAGTQVTGAGLVNVAALTKLQELGLYKTQVTDAGLDHLTGLMALQLLDLADTQVTAAGLAHLKGLVNLQSLNLNNTPVADDGLSHLQELMDLRVLFLNRTQIGNGGIAKLRGLANLRELYLGGTEVTDAGLSHLKGLTTLQKVGLSDTKVTDAGIDDLQQALPSLQVAR
jgi:Leucine-rich repeat (LRR) protein